MAKTKKFDFSKTVKDLEMSRALNEIKKINFLNDASIEKLVLVCNDLESGNILSEINSNFINSVFRRIKNERRLHSSTIETIRMFFIKFGAL